MHRSNESNNSFYSTWTLSKFTVHGCNAECIRTKIARSIKIDCFYDKKLICMFDCISIFLENDGVIFDVHKTKIDIIPHALIACAIPHSIAEGNSVSTFTQ